MTFGYQCDEQTSFEIMDGGRLGWVCDPFQAETIAEAFQRIWTLSDAEVDERRSLANDVCRMRFSEATIVPQLLHAFTRDE